MQAKDIVKLTEEAVMPILESKNFEFVDCEFVKEGPDWYLRVYIDKEGGISIDDCVYVSRALDERLVLLVLIECLKEIRNTLNTKAN